jgi:hypothetical protein
MYEAIGLLHLTLQCLGRDRLGDIVRDLVAPMVTAMTALPPTGAPNACRAGSRVDLANLQMRIVILSLAFQRDFPQHLAACGDQLAVAIVQLLATCPPDAITVRKSHLEKYVPDCLDRTLEIQFFLRCLFKFFAVCVRCLVLLCWPRVSVVFSIDCSMRTCCTGHLASVRTSFN